MRCFVAADIGEDARAGIGRIIGRLRGRVPGARWSAPESAHLTLQFLGEASEADAVRVREGLNGLESEGSIEARFGPLGAFPSFRAARVLWLGVETNGRLEALAGRVKAACRMAGLPGPDDKPFVAHLTLARLRQPRDLEHVEMEGDSGDTGRGQFVIDRVVFYQSVLHPTGSEYRVLGEVRLGGAGGAVA